MTKDRVILGIDPGTIVMGYGVLKIEGNKPKLEAMGVLQLNKYELLAFEKDIRTGTGPYRPVSP